MTTLQSAVDRESMAEVESFQVSHLPSDMPIFAALYQDVKNAAFLREQLMNGNEAFEYAFIDASMIISRQHALAAVFRAAYDYLSDRLKSRNVHSEIVFSLSSNNNIGEAFRRFGVTDTTTNLLVFKVPTSSGITLESVQQHLRANVQGTLVPFDDDHIMAVTDLQRIRKIHKLGAGDGGNGKRKKEVNGGVGEDAGAVDERTMVEVQVLGLMALRGAT